MKAREAASPDTVTGDPVANGAVVDVLVNGVTSGAQSFSLPGGLNWTATPDGFKYKDSQGVNGAVTRALIRKTPSGVFLIDLKVDGRRGPVNLIAPNTGNLAAVTFSITSGGSYCVVFGGAAGGSFTRNDDRILKILRPTAEVGCPGGTPDCGDGVVQAPFETCDVGNDAACPGACRPEGDPFECLCPFCGDGTINQGSEVCDLDDVGPCLEYCRLDCTCSSCGNAVIEHGEDCETDQDCVDQSMGTVCRSVPPFSTGDDGVCRCQVCGDGILDPGEDCEPDGPAGSCPFGCEDDCTCASSPSGAFLEP
jgi:hypothetical protein